LSYTFYLQLNIRPRGNWCYYYQKVETFEEVNFVLEVLDRNVDVVVFDCINALSKVLWAAGRMRGRNRLEVTERMSVISRQILTCLERSVATRFVMVPLARLWNFHPVYDLYANFVQVKVIYISLSIFDIDCKTMYVFLVPGRTVFID